LRVDTWQSIKFWTKKWTEVPYPSFLKTQVPFVMQIETNVPKNKVSKLQVSKRSLILNNKWKLNILLVHESRLYTKFDERSWLIKYFWTCTLFNKTKKNILRAEDHWAGTYRRYVHVYAIFGYYGELDLLHFWDLSLSGARVLDLALRRLDLVEMIYFSFNNSFNFKIFNPLKKNFFLFF
jgi:hypothetical protein